MNEYYKELKKNRVCEWLMNDDKYMSSDINKFQYLHKLMLRFLQFILSYYYYSKTRAGGYYCLCDQPTKKIVVLFVCCETINNLKLFSIEVKTNYLIICGMIDFNNLA